MSVKEKAGVVKVGVVKLGCVGTAPLLEYLLDERADRNDVDVRICLLYTSPSPRDRG